MNPVVILFGALEKAEAKADSDIDIAVFTATEKEADLEQYKKKLHRDIQLFVFKNRDAIKNPELLNSILNGVKISGDW